MTYIMSCVWLDYMVKYFQCKNCVGSSPKTKKCVASFLVPGDSSLNLESPINTGLSGFFFCSNVPVGLIRGSYWVLFSHTVLSLIKSAITFIALTFAACTACV